MQQMDWKQAKLQVKPCQNSQLQAPKQEQLVKKSETLVHQQNQQKNTQDHALPNQRERRKRKY
jgi:hypothetical protein